VSSPSSARFEVQLIRRIGITASGPSCRQQAGGQLHHGRTELDPLQIGLGKERFESIQAACIAATQRPHPAFQGALHQVRSASMAALLRGWSAGGCFNSHCRAECWAAGAWAARRCKSRKCCSLSTTSSRHAIQLCVVVKITTSPSADESSARLKAHPLRLGLQLDVGGPGGQGLASLLEGP